MSIHPLVFPPRIFAFLEQAMQNFSSINCRAINCSTQPYYKCASSLLTLFSFAFAKKMITVFPAFIAPPLLLEPPPPPFQEKKELMTKFVNNLADDCVKVMDE